MILTEIMAKSKKRKGAKKYKPPMRETRVMTMEEQAKMVFPTTPYCGVCGKETILAPKDEVEAYKEYDTSYRFGFIYAPACSCWEKPNQEDWMITE